MEIRKSTVAKAGVVALFLMATILAAQDADTMFDETNIDEALLTTLVNEKFGELCQRDGYTLSNEPKAIEAANYCLRHPGITDPTDANGYWLGAGCSHNMVSSAPTFPNCMWRSKPPVRRFANLMKRTPMGISPNALSRRCSMEIRRMLTIRRLQHSALAYMYMTVMEKTMTGSRMKGATPVPGFTLSFWS